MDKLVNSNFLEMMLPKTFNFFPNACYVCRKYGKDAKLKRCGNCKRIAYCSREHQREHWQAHKDVCKIASKLVKELSGSMGDTIMFTKAFNPKMSLIMMKEMSVTFAQSHMDRTLLPDEISIFLNPRTCLVCCETDYRLLTDCPDCPAISFCRDHANTEHKSICEQMQLCCDIDSFPILALYNIPVPIIDKDIPEDMQGLINLHRKEYEKKKTELPLNVWTAVTADRLSRPYTFLYAVRKLSTRKFPQNVHILGATEDEMASLHWWTMFKQKKFSKNFKITLIGPDLHNSSFTFNGLRVTTIEDFYHDYATSEQFTKPDFIVGFNLGVHYSSSENDTWAPTIREIEKQKCPVLLTFLALIDWDADSPKINRVLKRDAKLVHFGKNPYRSFKPIKDVPPEPIVYSNQYLAVYERL